MKTTCPKWCRGGHDSTPGLHMMEIGHWTADAVRIGITVTIEQFDGDEPAIEVFNAGAPKGQRSTRLTVKAAPTMAALFDTLGANGLAVLVRKAAGILAGTHCPACGRELTEVGGALMCLADAEQAGGGVR